MLVLVPAAFTVKLAGYLLDVCRRTPDYGPVEARFVRQEKRHKEEDRDKYDCSSNPHPLGTDQGDQLLRRNGSKLGLVILRDRFEFIKEHTLPDNSEHQKVNKRDHAADNIKAQHLARVAGNHSYAAAEGIKDPEIFKNGSCITEEGQK